MRLHPPLVFVGVVFFLQHFCLVVASVTYREKLAQPRPWGNDTDDLTTTLEPGNEPEEASTRRPVIFVTSRTLLVNSDAPSATSTEKPLNPSGQDPEVEVTPEEYLNCECLNFTRGKCHFKGCESSSGTCAVLAGGKEEPIVKMPKEREEIAPFLLPISQAEADDIIRCPYCGKSQLAGLDLHGGCMHCSSCGHALRFKNEAGKSSRVVLDEENDHGEAPRIGTAETPPADGLEKPLVFVPVRADVNLTRKDLLHRQLVYQRTQEYLKSIAPVPEKSSRTGIPAAFAGNSAENLRIMYGNRPSPTQTTSSTKRTFWDFFWPFGSSKTTVDDKKKEEIRSPALQAQTSNLAPSYSFRCPYMNQQARRK